MNYWLLTPEIALSVFAAAVIVLDFFVKEKRVLMTLSVAGAVVAGACALALWGTNSSFGGVLVVDGFSLFFKLLFLGVAILVILSSADYVSQFSRFQGEYYALILLSAVGMMLLAGAVELITIYIALELITIPLCALVCIVKSQRSSEAALKYLLLAALSSAVLLYGMALIFGLTGTTYLTEIAKAIPLGSLLDNPALLLGIIFLIAGFGFKIAAVPFQMWVPDVYEGAPTPITAYLAVASKAAGFAIIMRVFYRAFGFPEGIALDWGMTFAVLSAITMTIGNVVAIAQTNIKRMLGYSSIAHAGYLMIGLATISTLGQSGVMFFLISYALANLGAFFAVIAISNKTGSDQIKDFAGMARRAPVLSLVLAFCLISLTGIPPTAGFIAKIYVFNAAVQYGLLWLVIIAVINTAISAYYYLRVVKVMYTEAPASEERVPSSAALRFTLLVSSIGVLILGIVPGPLLSIAERAAGLFGL